LWLVRTVGLLIGGIGFTLLMAGRRKRVSAEIITLACGSAIALIAIDVYYSLSGVIWKIYLIDAAGELAILALWAWATRRPRSRAGSSVAAPGA
jgi:hypothetical protein